MMRRAGVADIPAIMAIERLPGYDLYIGRHDGDEHAAFQASEDAAEFVWEQDGRVRGFALLQKLASPHIAQAKTIAVDARGEGLGRPFVRALIDHVFTATGAHRLELDTSAENPRARRLYESLGFVHEGRVRDVYRYEGRYISSDLFSILRPEWEARAP